MRFGRVSTLKSDKNIRWDVGGLILLFRKRLYSYLEDNLLTGNIFVLDNSQEMRE